MKPAVLWAMALGCATLIGAGWGAQEYLQQKFASREQFLVAGGQLNYVMSRQEAALVREIATLEREQERRKLTPAERDRLVSLRAELKEMREVRTGK